MCKHKKCISSILAVMLCLGQIVTCVSAAEIQPAPSDNLRKNTYSPRSSPVESYLYEDRGQLVRVEYIDGHIVVEYYNADFLLQSQIIIDCDLPKWGGFFAGTEHNYVILGQDNPQENDSVEVLRIIKYDKDWNQLGYVGYYGFNTVSPFDAGSLRCAEDEKNLYIHTCHEMYKTDDGLNHQSNLTLSIRKSDLTLEAVSGLSPYLVDQTFGFYVSHSFDQYILVDQDGRIVTYDHGDGYPRSAVLQRGSTSVDIQRFAGSIGYNITNASLGGLAETHSGYVTAYHYEHGNVFLSFTPKNDFSTEATQIIQLWFNDEWNPYATPMLVSSGLDGGYVFWYGSTYTEYDLPQNSAMGQYTWQLYYTTYDSEGKIGDIFSINAELSDCQPLYLDDKVIWYVTDEGAPIFYVLENGMVSAYQSTWSNIFSDVEEGAWYYDAIAWAARHNITTGVSQTTFGVNNPCSTEEILTFLWRASGSPEPTMSNPFPDVADSNYYSKAIIWAVEKGVYQSISSGIGTPCTRSMTVAYLWRLAGSPTPSNTVWFTDVSVNADYAQAVAWAVEMGITNGTSETTFEPDAICSRTQIMTYLYRYFDA